VHSVIGGAGRVHQRPVDLPICGVMGLHKLTAGDGYTYLTRQVAAHDATEKGHTSLADYYQERGESPGRWYGTGLAGLDLHVGEPVTEAQMRALFAEGRHPNAERIEAAVIGAGGTPAEALAASALGRPFPVHTRQPQFRVEVARSFTEHNIGLGRHWSSPIPAEDRARIRTEVAIGMFTSAYDRPPADDRELAGLIASDTRQATTAVAGYDLTFSPVKSVSTLWAVAPREVAQQIEAAHHAAVKDTLRWLEQEAIYSREGAGGVRQVDVHGLAAAVFTHRDSRAGDPDLHSHVAVSNKVQSLDGRWLALDGRVLYKAKVSASERYNTRLEAELVARLGVHFEASARPTDGRRPVREIVGVDPYLARHWSRRRNQINSRRAQLASKFQAEHGRPPTPIEAIALAQQATLETRDGKHEPVSHGEQRARWGADAERMLGSPQAVEEMTKRSLSQRRGGGIKVTPEWMSATAALVIETVQANRATWQVWHVRAEAERQAREAGIPLTKLDAVVNEVVTQALSANHSVRLGASDPVSEPAALRRVDGVSVYHVAGSQAYTSRAIVDAEQRILSAAQTSGGCAISEVRVGIALAESAANGVELNPAQSVMVHDLACSGRLVQLALAPAGTGKTTAMAVLSRAWSDAGGQVIGLAPSAQAAAELSDAIDGHTDTLAKLTHAIAHPDPPAWVARIGKNTLVVVDEAGMAGTTDLAAVADHITSRGGVVRLVGDDRQLASVAAGGILRDIADTVGAVTLTDVRRFDSRAEAAATLALRDGDPAALGFYADHHRIHVGDPDTAAAQAYQAWKTDRAAGLDAILLAPTRDQVKTLNERARADRIPSLGEKPGREVTLGDGTQASVGDVVVTRRNDRRLIISGSDWVRNGDRWTIRTVHGDGSLTVQHHPLRRLVKLPADYVRDQVRLGYATTIHAAEGTTVDTTHTVLTGNETRQLLYVAMTRGRQSNHVYLASASAGDSHDLVKPATLLPPTAVDILTTILDRDGSHQSATTTARTFDSPTTLLHQAVLRYVDAVGVAAEHHLGDDGLRDLDKQLDALIPGIIGQPAYPTLRACLALRAAAGDDPITLAADAAGDRELGTADDPSAVLDWRIGGTTDAEGPLPWVPAVPHALAEHPDWGPYLDARTNRIRSLAGRVYADALSWTRTTSPEWAQSLVDLIPSDLLGDLAVWRACFDVPDTDTRPTGALQVGADANTHQHTLNRRVRRSTGGTGNTSTHDRWTQILPERVTADHYAPRLLERLDNLKDAGTNVHQLLTTCLTERALPDEQAAAALWWRIVDHLGPVALPASNLGIRPAWTPILVEHLGQRSAERIMSDRAWPALIAAITAASLDEWTPDTLLTAAIGGIAPAGRQSTVPVEDLCEALVWRIATLTDPAMDLEQLPPDPADAERKPSCDLEPALIEEPTERRRRSQHDDPLQDLLRSSRPQRSSQHESPAEAASDRDIAQRLIQLNKSALDYYTRLYPRSWAPDYLRGRLGTDLLNDPRFTPGYAPPGPTSLTRHLQQHGAGIDDLVAAGLARESQSGKIIDAFRDRFVLPIHNQQGDLVGFIGRRNPTKNDDPYAGPKYLNTATTPVFHKAQVLYGLHEGATDVAAGARLVLIEGPLDAIAVTIASNGGAVGLAPLGTAFTDHQADQLRGLLREDPARVIVATDADPAGWNAAQRAYWMLTARGANPQHLTLPDGTDPAGLLHDSGAEVLRRSLTRTRSLADSMIDRAIASADDLTTKPAERLALVRLTGQAIGALPPENWLEHINAARGRLQLPVGMLHLEVAHQGSEWGSDPQGHARERIGEIARPYYSSRAVGAGPIATQWRRIIEQMHPGITASPNWPALANTLQQAHRAGHDVKKLLHEQASHQPRLPGDSVACEDIQYRILSVFEPSTPPEHGRSSGGWGARPLSGDSLQGGKPTPTLQNPSPSPWPPNGGQGPRPPRSIG
jgi:DNA primase catalytic core